MIIQVLMCRYLTRLVCAAVPLGLLSGCVATVTSTLLPPCPTLAACAEGGFVYSLPEGRYYLQASRLPITAQDVAAAAAALSAANAAVQKDQAAIATAQAKLGTDQGAKASADILAADMAAVTSLQSTLAIDQQLLGLAQTTLNRTTAQLGQGTETFSLSPLQIVPDPSARFAANLHHSVFKDDNLKIDAASGLLTSTTTSSTDQSLNSLVSLLQTGISLATFSSAGIPLIPPAAPFPAPPVAAAAPPQFPLACTYQLAEYFNPLSKSDVDRVNNALLANHATIRLEVIPTPVDPPSSAIETSNSKASSGLFYRVPTTAIVTVRPVGAHDSDSAAWTSADAMWSAGGPTINSTACPLISKPIAMSQLAILPDTADIYRIDADTGAFTTSTHSYTFTNGMLTGHQVNRPSEVTAPVQALGTLAQGIIAIPASILQLKVNYANSTDALVKAQSTLASDRMNAVSNALTAKAAVDNAAASLVTAEFASPQAYVAAQTNLLKAQQALQALINSNSPTTGSTTTPAPSASSLAPAAAPTP